MKRLACVTVLAGVALAASPRADADMYTATLSGPAESPPNASPGTGSTIVTFNPVTHVLRVQAIFSGLIGNVTASHIHAATASPGTGTAGVATQTPTFSGFPSGVTAGTYDNTFDTSLASSWNAAYITANGGTTAGAEAAFFTALNAGTAYLNIHTSSFAGGEIRGFLTAIPEPSPFALAAVGGTIVLLARRGLGLVRRSKAIA